jgi:cell division septal protein FtsQ
MIEKKKKVKSYSNRFIVGLVMSIVMMAIILVVSWIYLSPKIAQLRVEGRRQNCRDNIRILGQSLLMYSCDYDDKFPDGQKL